MLTIRTGNKPTRMITWAVGFSPLSFVTQAFLVIFARFTRYKLLNFDEIQLRYGLHRSGRANRLGGAGNGRVVSIVSKGEVQHIKQVSRRLGIQIKVGD